MRYVQLKALIEETQLQGEKYISCEHFHNRGLVKPGCCSSCHAEWEDGGPTPAYQYTEFDGPLFRGIDITVCCDVGKQVDEAVKEMRRLQMAVIPCS